VFLTIKNCGFTNETEEERKKKKFRRKVDEKLNFWMKKTHCFLNKIYV
jgi:hypothetical protein